MAEALVSGSVDFVAAAKSCLLELDAWRVSTSGASGDSATPTSAHAYPSQTAGGAQFDDAARDTEPPADR
jgi:hypothetical protein